MVRFPVDPAAAAATSSGEHLGRSIEEFFGVDIA